MGLAVLMCAFMLRAAYTDGIAIFAQKAIGVVVYPFQKVAAEISSGVTNMLQGYLRTEQLQEENEQLKEEIPAAARISWSIMSRLKMKISCTRSFWTSRSKTLTLSFAPLW